MTLANRRPSRTGHETRRRPNPSRSATPWVPRPICSTPWSCRRWRRLRISVLAPSTRGGHYEAAIEAAQVGQAATGTSSATVQLALQEAKGHALVGNKQETHRALSLGNRVLAKVPAPAHAEHHFVFDHTKWSFYVSDIYAQAGADSAAEEHAQAVLARHVRPDGSSNAPMRVAGARLDLAIVRARRGDLDGALSEGVKAFDYERRSTIDLLRRAGDLGTVLDNRYPRDPATGEFRELLRTTRRSLLSID